MDRLNRLRTGLGLAGLEFVSHFSLVAAHAGESHPPSGAAPWPIAGPIIALLVIGAVYWLSNRDGSRRPPSPAADTSDPAGPAHDQSGSRSDVSRGLPAHRHGPRKRADLVALQSGMSPSTHSVPRTLEETWMTLDSTP